MSQEVATMAANGTLALSPRERVSFTPDHYLTDGQAREGACTYVLKPLRNRERIQVALKVREKLGNFVATFEVRDLMRDAARISLEPDEAANACGLLDELDALEEATEQSDEVTERLAEIRKQL